MSGRAFVFINYLQALRFGHVGWAFSSSNQGADAESEQFVYGSADHLLRRPYWDLIALARYSYVAPGGDIDFWCDRGSLDNMLKEMAAGHHIYYHAYKEIPVARPDYHGALAFVEGIKAGGWCLLGNNCVNQTVALLRTYGADPDKLPDASLFPRRWFGAIKANENTLSRPTTKSKTDISSKGERAQNGQNSAR